MKYALALIPLAFLLTACDPPPAAQETGERHDTQPRPQAQKSSSGGLCMPCVGPHFNIMKGGVSMFSMGPGIGF